MGINRITAQVQFPIAFAREFADVDLVPSAWQVPVTLYYTDGESPSNFSPKNSSIIYLRVFGERDMSLNEVQEKAMELCRTMFNNQLNVEISHI